MQTIRRPNHKAPAELIIGTARLLGYTIYSENIIGAPSRTYIYRPNGCMMYGSYVGVVDLSHDTVRADLYDTYKILFDSD